MRSQTTARLLLALLALSGALLPALTGGCTFKDVRGLHRVEVPAGDLKRAQRRSDVLAAHLRDGGVVLFSSWSVDDSIRTVAGTGRRLDPDRRPVAGESHVVSLDSVALFESRRTDVPAALAPITLVTAASISLSVYCLWNPKACFGSCPTFYAHVGDRQTLVAEGFSASVAPALEYDDLDALDLVHVNGPRFTLTMTNEALETHVVRRADLLLVPRAGDERVVADESGTLWATRDWLAPDAARDEAGDCRDALAARDAGERTSLADSTDLASSEFVTLSFARAPPGDRALVIVARQSLLSTYVFYQTLAWMGRSAGRWLASLASADTSLTRRIEGPARALGPIEVQVLQDGRWVAAGRFHETGPLAWDSRLVPLPAGPAGPLDVRLRLTRGMWRMDQVALVTVAGRREVQRIRPAAVLRRGHPDPAALASLLTGTPPLVTSPGDTLAIEYEFPPGLLSAEAFLETRGYYLEWMREAWIAEENPERLAQLLLDPAGALRRMAPEYKRLEPEMERSFWGSRYAR
ncbi:MAG: hypothetical protein IT347_07485 [Candidatus Eisenbacteria bacterium]|nr:hypothetical protein [Candidatus Eisenbacteria bacterium]